MKKKAIWYIAAFLALLLCLFTYFRPLSLSGNVSDRSEITLILNEYAVRNGKPDIAVTEYQNITDDQKSAILATLDKYTYRRTLDTLFSDGSMSGMGNQVLYIYVFQDSSDSYLLAIAQKEIVINDNNYRLKQGGQLIEQIIQIVEKNG